MTFALGQNDDSDDDATGDIFVIGVDGLLVLQQLVGVDALELTLGILAVALKTVTQGTCQRVTLHLPELSRLDACGVELEYSTHR